jgi:hypothetical protein
VRGQVLDLAPDCECDHDVVHNRWLIQIVGEAAAGKVMALNGAEGGGGRYLALNIRGNVLNCAEWEARMTPTLFKYGISRTECTAGDLVENLVCG